MAVTYEELAQKLRISYPGRYGEDKWSNEDLVRRYINKEPELKNYVTNWETLYEPTAEHRSDDLDFAIYQLKEQFNNVPAWFVGSMASVTGSESLGAMAEEYREEAAKWTEDYLTNNPEIAGYLKWIEEEPISKDNFWHSEILQRSLAQAGPSMATMVVTDMALIPFTGGIGALVNKARYGKKFMDTYRGITKGKEGFEKGAKLAQRTRKVGTMGSMGVYEASGEYNEAMSYLVEEKGMDPLEAQRIATASAAIYGTISGVIEYMPYNHFKGILSETKKEGQSRLIKRITNSVLKDRPFVQGVANITANAVKQGIAEGGQEWSQYMTQALTQYAYKKGYGDTEETAFEEFAKQMLSPEAISSAHAGGTMGLVMGIGGGVKSELLPRQKRALERDKDPDDVITEDEITYETKTGEFEPLREEDTKDFQPKEEDLSRAQLIMRSFTGEGLKGLSSENQEKIQSVEAELGDPSLEDPEIQENWKQELISIAKEDPNIFEDLENKDRAMRTIEATLGQEFRKEVEGTLEAPKPKDVEAPIPIVEEPKKDIVEPVKEEAPKEPIIDEAPKPGVEPPKGKSLKSILEGLESDPAEKKAQAKGFESMQDLSAEDIQNRMPLDKANKDLLNIIIDDAIKEHGNDKYKIRMAIRGYKNLDEALGQQDLNMIDRLVDYKTDAVKVGDPIIEEDIKETPAETKFTKIADIPNIGKEIKDGTIKNKDQIDTFNYKQKIQTLWGAFTRITRESAANNEIRNKDIALFNEIKDLESSLKERGIEFDKKLPESLNIGKDALYQYQNLFSTKGKTKEAKLAREWVNFFDGNVTGFEGEKAPSILDWGTLEEAPAEGIKSGDIVSYKNKNWYLRGINASGKAQLTDLETGKNFSGTPDQDKVSFVSKADPMMFIKLKDKSKQEVPAKEMISEVSIPEIEEDIPSQDLDHAIFKSRVNKIDYTQDQINVLTDAISFIEASQDTERKEPRVYSGYAGTGKTTIVENIANQAVSAGHSVIIGAPTNKAVRRLKEVTNIDEIPRQLEYSTIHGVLYGAMKEDGTFGAPKSLTSKDFLILDEASMIDQNLYDDLISAAVSKGAKVIFLGDSFQLRPVGKDPRILSNPTVQLTEVRRQSLDSDILKYATALRTENTLNSKNLYTPSTGSTANFTVTPSAKNEFLKSLSKGEDAVLITATNANRVQANKFGREFKFGKDKADANIILPREQIIFIANSRFFKNSEQFTVKDYEIRHVTKIKVQVAKNEQVTMEAVFFTTNGKTIMLVPGWPKPGLQHSQIKEYPSEYKDKFGMSNSVAIATHGYSITAHKSQGSEWDKVFVDYDMIGDKGMDPRWMYTAITRGKEEVILQQRQDLPQKSWQDISAAIGIENVQIKSKPKPPSKKEAPVKPLKQEDKIEPDVVKTVSDIGVSHIKFKDTEYPAKITGIVRQVIKDTEGTTTKQGHKAVWFGEQDYEYVGSYHSAKDMPKSIKGIQHKVEEVLGLEKDYYNSVLINEFPAKVGIKKHSDNEKILRFDDDTIRSVGVISLGGSATIDILKGNTVVESHRIDEGDIYELPSGDFQDTYLHQVGPSDQPRYSLTFRKTAPVYDVISNIDHSVLLPEEELHSIIASEKPLEILAQPGTRWIVAERLFSRTWDRVNKLYLERYKNNTSVGEKISVEHFLSAMESKLQDDWRIEGFYTWASKKFPASSINSWNQDDSKNSYIDEKKVDILIDAALGETNEGLDIIGRDSDFRHISLANSAFEKSLGIVMLDEDRIKWYREAFRHNTPEKWLENTLDKFKGLETIVFEDLSRDQKEALILQYHNVRSQIKTNRKNTASNDHNSGYIIMEGSDISYFSKGEKNIMTKKSNPSRVRRHVAGIDKKLNWVSAGDIYTRRMIKFGPKKGSSKITTKYDALTISEFKEFNESLIASGVGVIAFTKGDSSIAIADIETKHKEIAKDTKKYEEYWAKENMNESQMKNWMKATTLNGRAAQIARYEAVKRYYPEFMDDSLANVFKRLKIPFTPVILANNTRDFTAKVLDSKKISYVYPNGKEVKWIKKIKDLDPLYPGDGGSPTSSDTFREYNDKIGINSSSDVNKNVIYTSTDKGSLFIKHLMYKPDGPAQIYENYGKSNEKLIGEIRSDGNIYAFIEPKAFKDADINKFIADNNLEGANASVIIDKYTDEDGNSMNILSSAVDTILEDKKFSEMNLGTLQDKIEFIAAKKGLLKRLVRKLGNIGRAGEMEFLDHIFTKDEAKVLTKEYDKHFQDGSNFIIRGGSVGYISDVKHKHTKVQANDQLLNFLDDPGLIEAFRDAMIPPMEKQINKLYRMSRGDVAANMNALGERMRKNNDEAIDNIVADGFELGLGRHPSIAGWVNTVLQTSFMNDYVQMANKEGIAEKLQWDQNDELSEEEVAVSNKNATIVYREYVADSNTSASSIKEASQLPLLEINEWLEENEIWVLAYRMPTPHVNGAAMVRIKKLHDSADVVRANPNTIFRRWEGDGDGDTLFMHSMPSELTQAFRRYYSLPEIRAKVKGVNLNEFTKQDAKKYDFSNINDSLELMQSLMLGAKGISEIAKIQRIYGQLNQRNIRLFVDGSEITLRSPQENVETNEMIKGSKRSVEDMLRIYLQAAVDNGKYMLLGKWNYKKEALRKRLWKRTDGKDITDSQFIVLNEIMDLHGHTGNIRNASTIASGQWGFAETNRESQEYLKYVGRNEDGSLGNPYSREKYIRSRIINMESYKKLDPKNPDKMLRPTIGKIFMDAGLSVQEEIILQPGLAYERYQLPGDAKSPFLFLGHDDINGDVNVYKMAHDASYKYIENEIMSEFTIDQKEGTLGIRYGNDMMRAFYDMFDSLREKGVELDFLGWSTNEVMIKFTQDWQSEYNKLSQKAKEFATFTVLQGVRRNFGTKSGKQRYTHVLPPISKRIDGVTLLEPKIMSEYLKQYNTVLNNEMNTKSPELQEKSDNIALTSLMIRKKCT